MPLAAGIAAVAWEKPGKIRSLSEMTAPEKPLLTASHVGFRPDARKRIVARVPATSGNAQLLIASSAAASRAIPVPAGSPSGFDFRATPVFLNDLYGEGSYRASLGDGHAFSFNVARDVWLGVIPTLAGYAHHQRCGYSDRASHAICHLDDGRRRDTGDHADTSGGWHDAGDLRKWVDATIMNLFGLTALARNLKTHPAAGPSSLPALLDEAKYGNAFFLKMQDADGLVWADVGGGVHGDNSDNHWTDNTVGSADDRWINVEKRPAIQAMFVAAQAILYQLFSMSNPGYAATCLDAASRCWRASTRSGSSLTDIAWRTLAAVEMSAAVPRLEYGQEVVRLADQLTSLQVRDPPGRGDAVRGFFPMWIGNQQPLRDAVHSALPAIALLHAAQSAAGHSSGNAKKWSGAVRLYIDDYAAPLASRSAYAIVPFGLFLDAPADENYRPLTGRYSYRFFMPSKNKGFSGLNSHLLSHALLFAEAERYFAEAKYRDMAYSHLEWVFGANPFGASLVTGVGFNQPPAFSPFVGLIPGGIMNGICGNEEDQPVLNQESAKDWRTNEYWSPHSGYCQWALSVLESPPSA